MIVETAFSASLENIAKALRAGVFHANKSWLKAVRAYAMQVRPEEGVPAYASARTLAAPFTFRVVLNGSEKDALTVHALDEVKLAKGVARLAALDPASFARVAAGNAEAVDGERLLQLALFGALRFEAKAEAPAKPAIKAREMSEIIAAMKAKRA